MKKSHIKLLDKAWSQAVKILAGFKCEYCLRADLLLNSCHIIGRTYRATRWDLDNGMCLCFIHHKQYDEHGPEEKNIFNNLIGESRYDRLREKAMHSVTKQQDFDEIRKEIKKSMEAHV